MLNSDARHTFSYESMGTSWEISIWDNIPQEQLTEIKEGVIGMSRTFDETYSRFIKTSLVWRLATEPGTTEIPGDLTQMLLVYQRLYHPSDKKLNPLIGFSISDLGYDADYTLTPKESIRATPDFEETLTLKLPNSLTLREPALIDVGALGKGFFVDKIATLLSSRGIERYLVNGSGDIFYCGGKKGAEIAINVGLEDPADSQKVLGIIALKRGSICASGINRRVWSTYNHVIDPHTLSSPTETLATWVMAPTATYADALASCLFFVEPEKLSEFTFEYCILNKDRNIKRSAGFTAELF